MNEFATGLVAHHAGRFARFASVPPPGGPELEDHDPREKHYQDVAVATASAPSAWTLSPDFAAAYDP